MNIKLIFRNNKAGFSLYRVFQSFSKNSNEKDQISEVFVPYFQPKISMILKNINYIRKSINKDDIVHVTGDIHYVLLGLKRKKTILTIPDTVLLDCRKKNIKWYLYYFLWYFFPCKFAKRVVCISEETKKRLVSYLGTDKRISVIPVPVASQFSYQEHSFNEQKPIILHVGTGWNKNLENVILALKGIDCHLHIVGRISQNVECMLKDNEITYTILTDLSSDDLIKEYVNCDIVSFPSVYEGFGMPILEGQATGRCVLTSNIEPMTSVAGKEGAVFVDPHKIENIRDGFLAIINDKELRKQIIQKGKENVEKYSEKSIFEQYRILYNELASETLYN